MKPFFDPTQQLEMATSLCHTSQQHDLHTNTHTQQLPSLALVPAPRLENQASIATYKQVEEREDNFDDQAPSSTSSTYTTINTSSTLAAASATYWLNAPPPSKRSIYNFSNDCRGSVLSMASVILIFVIAMKLRHLLSSRNHTTTTTSTTRTSSINSTNSINSTTSISPIRTATAASTSDFPMSISCFKASMKTQAALRPNQRSQYFLHCRNASTTTKQTEASLPIHQNGFSSLASVANAVHQILQVDIAAVNNEPPSLRLQPLRSSLRELYCGTRFIHARSANTVMDWSISENWPDDMDYEDMDWSISEDWPDDMDYEDMDWSISEDWPDDMDYEDMDWSISEDWPDDMDYEDMDWSISEDWPDDMDWEDMSWEISDDPTDDMDWEISQDPPDDMDWEILRSADCRVLGLCKHLVRKTPPPQVRPTKRQRPNTSKTAVDLAHPPAILPPVVALVVPHQQVRDVIVGALGDTSANVSAVETRVALPAGQQELCAFDIVQVESEETQQHNALGNALAEPSIAAPLVEAAGEHDENVAGGASIVNQATRQQQLLGCDDFVPFESLDDDDEVYQYSPVLNSLVEPSITAPLSEIDLEEDEDRHHPKEDTTLPPSPAASFPLDLEEEDSNLPQVEEEPPTNPHSSAHPRRVTSRPCRRSTRIILAALKDTGSLYSTSGKRRSARLLTRLNAGI
jgi:hypothetical protein